MLANDPQFSADLSHQFAEKYGFVYVTSSPRYPQSNGEAERAVKMLLKKNWDPYIALLNYRALPLQNGESPAELLMGRKQRTRLRTQLPALPCVLDKKVGSEKLDLAKESEEIYRTNQERNFDQRHHAKDLPQLGPGDCVWIRDQDRHGEILWRMNHPHLYLVRTDMGSARKNRSALVHTGAIRDDPPEQWTDSTGTWNVLVPQPAVVTSPRLSTQWVSMPDTPVRQQTPKTPRVPERAQLQPTQLASPAARPVPTYITRARRVSKPSRRLDL